jgi:transcriptional regulator with XRE-family HTH domain
MSTAKQQKGEKIMKTLDEIRRLLEGRNLARVGREVGLTRAYLSRIRRGEACNPSYDVVERLSAYLERPTNDQ